MAVSLAFVSAESYLPEHDDVVLETLPRSLSAARGDLGQLWAAQRARPDDANAAAALGTRLLEIGRSDGDPRYFGQARAAIARWWRDPSPPPPVLHLRARLEEREHRYDAALDDLRALVGMQPRNAQAWLEIANLLRVRGRYDEAFAACDAVAVTGGRTAVTLCRAPLLAMTGGAARAYAALGQMSLTDLPSGTVAWVHGVRGEIAQQFGDRSAAEKHFRAGLAVEPAHGYLLRAYADMLLDAGRPGEAASLLDEHLADNGMALRAAIAARDAGDSARASELGALLARRFAEIRLRGGVPHGRFEARYALTLRGEPTEALALALDNWARQKEPRDMRNVLEAAIAAGEPRAAEPVADFITANGFADATLDALLRELGKV